MPSLGFFMGGGSLRCCPQIFIVLLLNLRFPQTCLLGPALLRNSQKYLDRTFAIVCLNGSKLCLRICDSKAETGHAWIFPYTQKVNICFIKVATWKGISPVHFIFFFKKCSILKRSTVLFPLTLPVLLKVSDIKDSKYSVCSVCGLIFLSL